jgi:hypothetical protein
MELPDAGILAAVFTGLATLVAAVGGLLIKFRQMRNAHLLQMAQVRADQYLVDYDELEDLRWWRRLAIGVVNKFLDDYTQRSVEPPVDVHAVLDYPPPDRPRSKSGRRLKP